MKRSALGRGWRACLFGFVLLAGCNQGPPRREPCTACPSSAEIQALLGDKVCCTTGQGSPAYAPGKWTPQRPAEAAQAALSPPAPAAADPGAPAPVEVTRAAPAPPPASLAIRLSPPEPPPAPPVPTPARASLTFAPPSEPVAVASAAREGPSLVLEPAEPDAPRRAVADLTAAACFGHAPDYRWISGQVEYSHTRKEWRLRYASVDETDAHGGRVVLIENGHVNYLADGQYVRVEGHLVTPRDYHSGPAYYRIESFQVIDQPNTQPAN